MAGPKAVKSQVMQLLHALRARWNPKAAPGAPPLVLTGKRILLRPVEPEDAEATFAFVSDPEVTRYLPWEPASSVEMVEAFLEQQRARRQKGDSLAFSIVLKETGAVIGSTDLMQLRSVAPPTAELGYILAREYWGRGLMTEAAILSRDHAFRALKRRLLIGYADQDNVGSCRVLEKMGMLREGTEWRTVKDQTRLYVRYELPRERWEEFFRE